MKLLFYSSKHTSHLDRMTQRDVYKQLGLDKVLAGLPGWDKEMKEAENEVVRSDDIIGESFVIRIELENDVSKISNFDYHRHAIFKL